MYSSNERRTMSVVFASDGWYFSRKDRQWTKRRSKHGNKRLKFKRSNKPMWFEQN